MKRISLLMLLAGFFTITLIQISCKKDDKDTDSLKVTTSIVSAITQNSAISGGKITSQDSVIVTARGICWSTTPSPTIANDTTSNGTGTGSFISNISGLIPSTKYYVRAYATYSGGTAYGSQVSFTTTSPAPCPGMPTVTDYNGNIYNTVQIGNQCWMKENLKARNYKDGTTIPNITVSSSWTGLSTGARCWYNNDSATYANTFGALYNGYAVGNSNGLCPAGWHVPNNLEWATLIDSLGGAYVAGGHLKEAKTVHWQIPNPSATNSSGFSALPGGCRYYNNGNFNKIGAGGYWWSSEYFSSFHHYFKGLNYQNSYVEHGYENDVAGVSVRCIRD